MSNISQFFKGDTRKKNRKIFLGPGSNVTWTAPPSTSEIEVHVWGGGGHGGAGSPGEGKEGGGGGGYVGNTFQVIGGSTVVVSAGATANTSTAVITNPNGPSTLTATGGTPGGPYVPAPTRGNAGSGSYSLHPAEPTAYVFTASGGHSRNSGPDWPAPVQAENAPSGGGGAGFIYGPGGNGGYVPNHFGPQYPAIPSQKLSASPGGGGIKGRGGFTLAASPFPNGAGGIGGAGGGFMDGDDAGFDNTWSQLAFGGAGISGRFMGSKGEMSGTDNDTWFYLEDIDGIGGSSGSDFVFTGNPGNPTPEWDHPEVKYAKNGLAGGGGAGAPSTNGVYVRNGRLQGGHGGIFGGGGGGGSNGIGGNGGYGGGGGGGAFSSFHSDAFSGKGGAGIVIIYY